MSAEQKRVVVMALQTEIRAVETDIQRTGPKKDYFGSAQHDVRLAHLNLCRGALAEVQALRVSP